MVLRGLVTGAPSDGRRKRTSGRLSKLNQIAVPQRGFRLPQPVHEELAFAGLVANDLDTLFDRKVCMPGAYRCIKSGIKSDAAPLAGSKHDGVRIELLSLSP